MFNERSRFSHDTGGNDQKFYIGSMLDMALGKMQGQGATPLYEISYSGHEGDEDLIGLTDLLVLSFSGNVIDATNFANELSEIEDPVQIAKKFEERKITGLTIEKKA